MRTPSAVRRTWRTWPPAALRTIAPASPLVAVPAGASRSLLEAGCGPPFSAGPCAGSVDARSACPPRRPLASSYRTTAAVMVTDSTGARPNVPRGSSNVTTRRVPRGAFSTAAMATPSSVASVRSSSIVARSRACCIPGVATASRATVRATAIATRTVTARSGVSPGARCRHPRGSRVGHRTALAASPAATSVAVPR